MRIQSMQIQSGLIQKEYSLTNNQQEKILLYFDTYVRWIQEQGFHTPKTDFKKENGRMTMIQQYIEGRPATDMDWRRLIDIFLKLPDNMAYGLDTNPMNFLFTQEKVYFVDFYPLIIKDTDGFLSSQFPYNEKLIINRYFSKWNILACFLNRLKIIDPNAFQICLAFTASDILQHLTQLTGRDARRLAQAITSKSDTFKVYYAASKNDEKSLDQSSTDHLGRLLALYSTPSQIHNLK